MPRTEMLTRELCGECERFFLPRPECRLCSGTGYVEEWVSLEAVTLAISTETARLVAAGVGGAS